jgi:hypothetical protein
LPNSPNIGQASPGRPISWANASAASKCPIAWGTSPIPSPFPKQYLKDYSKRAPHDEQNIVSAGPRRYITSSTTSASSTAICSTGRMALATISVR